MLPNFGKRLMDHLKFRRTEIESPRHKPQAIFSPPSRNNIQYGRSLSQKVDIVIKSFEEIVELQPPEFNPAFIFKIKVEGSISDDDWRRCNLTVLSEDLDNTIVLFSPDQLVEFRNRIGAYSEPVVEGKKYPRYLWIANLTEDMKLWGRENRIGRKLQNLDIDSKREYYFDVELWVYGTNEENQRRLTVFVQFIIKNGGRVTDQYIGEDLLLARVRAFGSILDLILENGNVREVDLPPEPAMEMPEYYHSKIDNFPNPIDTPEDDSPGICVIDSGMAVGHPVLANAVGDARTFPITLGTEIDENGHGTMVSGLALYGDVEACINTLNFSPQMFLYSAKVTNAENRFDDESLIVTQMEQAIQYYVNNFNCRVFNISLADPELVYADGKPSLWASTLDNLVKEYDIVLVVSVGNVPVTTYSGRDAELVRADYPSYLLNDESRILEPSTAVNVLSVGSICLSNSSFHAGRQPGDLIIPIGEINMPSPFTRCGPGVNEAIKPDIVEYGGNSAWHASQRRFLQSDPGLDIVSTNHDFHTGLFAAMNGTSFSTPRVAHLAGLILKKYPGISANLVRALIANSAEIPEITKARFESEEDIQKLYGYGLPDEERALFSTDNRVLLMAEDVIATDVIHIYEIPIPDVFRITKGERKITICLAYDPPVRHTRKDYIGVNMEFRLIRGRTTSQIFDWYSEHRVDETDPIPPRYNCNLQPTIKKRGGGTLYKATFRFSQNRALEDYPGDVFHLLVKSKKGWASSDIFPNQRYAVTVSIEHLGVQIDFYNILRSQVRLDTRDRGRIRI